jgi:VWFA-related protein
VPATRAQAGSEPQAPRETSRDANNAHPIRANVEVVSVDVTVTDAQGRFAEGLRKDDFHVFDDGLEQPVSYFASNDAPAQVLLLVEIGPAVYILRDEHLQAAYALLQGLAPDDRVGVASYMDKAASVLGFTTDKRMVSTALDSLRFNLGMGDLNLADALESAIAWRGLGKRSIVLLSTGVDTSAPEHWARSIEQLHVSGVTVYAVALGGILREPSSEKKRKNAPNAAPPVSFEEADRALKAIADASGGRAFFPRNAQEFQAAYRQIATLVRHQYSLGFAPTARDGRVHRLEVRVELSAAQPAFTKTASTFRVDCRRAYIAPAQ